MTTQLTTPILGVNKDIASSSAPFTDMPLGSRVQGVDGQEWLKVKANGVIDQYDAVVIDENWDAIVCSLTNTASTFGNLVGVAPVAATDNQDLWAQVAGIGTVNVLINCAAHVVLNSTATDGSLDDDGGVGSEDIPGIVLPVAATAAGEYECIINMPSVGVTN